MTAREIIDIYISFFEHRGHKRIPNAPLVPENDPTTLFTNSGMQPLIPYLAGEPHPEGRRFVNVQNVFRGHGVLDDISEVGDNRHLTFFRMQGNWSLGDYFKKEQLRWIFELLTKDYGIDPKKLSVSVFEGYKEIPKDETSVAIWEELFRSVRLNPKERISFYGAEKNWWSRAGLPEHMPVGELGGPDSEIFYDFGQELQLHETSQYKNEGCHINCDCGRYLEISNNVFMTFKKIADGTFEQLPQKNVDFGAGTERLLMAVENQPDVFKTSLFYPIMQTIEKQTDKTYDKHQKQMRMIADHFVSASFIIAAGVKPSNTEQGYILRRLIRRSLDAYTQLQGVNLEPIIESVVEQYKGTDPILTEKFEEIKNTILQEKEKYEIAQEKAKKYIEKKYSSTQPHPIRSEPHGRILDPRLNGEENKQISAEDAFILYSTHGLSPTQIENLGYTFDKQAFAWLMEEHQNLSRKGASMKFSGGLADHQERTVMGHTATHLLQQALRDVLGNHIHQTGSNITTERLRFDFSHHEKLTDEQIKQVAEIVNQKIQENLPVHYEMLPLQTAKELGAIGLFDEKYQERVKVYFIGGSGKEGDHNAYSKEFCGGPHVDFTSKVKSFKIIKQENIGNKQRRIYAVVG